MKHTPGPWERFGLLILDPAADTNYLIAEVAESGDNATANARLIAAAPKLLEALQNLLDVRRGEGGTDWSSALAIAAIAEATGT